MTHSFTRRCVERRLYLKPTREVSQILLYSLGRALQGRRIELHAYCANANHDHGAATDRPDGMPAPEGASAAKLETSDLPEFMGHFRSLSARALNTHYGRGGAFWASGSYDNCEHWNEEAQVRQCLYVWTQVVRDGLVERLEDWSGVLFLPEHFGKTLRVEKPKGAFFGGRGKERVRPSDPYALAHWLELVAEEAESTSSAAKERQRKRERRRRRKGKPGTSKRRKRQLDHDRTRRAKKKKAPAPKPTRDRSKLPDFVEITIVPPPAFQHWPIEDVRSYFRERLDRELERIRAEREELGKRVLGIDRVMAEDPRTSVGPTWPTFARNPRVVCPGDTERRLEVLRRLQDWRRRYRSAWEARAQGETDVVFPEGTYGLRRFHDVRVRSGSGPPLRAA